MTHAAHTMRSRRVLTKLMMMAAASCCLPGYVLADAKEKRHAESPQMLLLGNSLTRHGPASAIHWDGNWGMAASAPDKDYASQLSHMLSRGAGQSPWHIHRESAGALEAAPQQYTPSDDVIKRARQASLVVMQAGDNVDANKVKLDDFARHYGRVAAALRPPKGVLVCISTWWPSPEKDRLIQAACQQAGGTFIDISDIAKQPGNIARSERSFKHDGVASHPGDAGMLAIAKRIHQSLPSRP